MQKKFKRRVKFENLFIPLHPFFVADKEEINIT